MYKDYELTVQPGVTAADPTEFIKEFPPCVIDEFKVTFPKGPNREVYVKVYHEGESVFPLDPPEWINGEDEEVICHGPWSNWDNLYCLRIRLCSPGARLPHKVIVRFNLTEHQSGSTIRNAIDSLTSHFLPMP